MFILPIASAGYLYVHPQWEYQVSFLNWAVPLGIFILALIVYLFLVPYSIYKAEKEKWERMKAEEYYKYNDEAQKDKLHRIFSNLQRHGENERLSAPLRWKNFYENDVEIALIDNLPDRERLNRYRVRLQMIGGATENETIKNRFEESMNFIEEVIKDDFYGMIRLL